MINIGDLVKFDNELYQLSEEQFIFGKITTLPSHNILKVPIEKYSIKVIYSNVLGIMPGNSHFLTLKYFSKLTDEEMNFFNKLTVFEK